MRAGLFRLTRRVLGDDLLRAALAPVERSLVVVGRLATQGSLHAHAWRKALDPDFRYQLALTRKQFANHDDEGMGPEEVAATLDSWPAANGARSTGPSPSARPG